MNARLAAALARCRTLTLDAAADLAHNLRMGLRLALLRPLVPEALRARTGALLLLFVVVLLLGLSYDFYAVGWQGGRFDVQALPMVGFWALSTVLGAWLLAAAGRDAALAGPLAAAGFTLTVWQVLAGMLCAFAADHFAAVDRWYGLLAWLPPLWAALAYAVAVRRMFVNTEAPPARAASIAAGMLAFAFALAPQWIVDSTQRLWTGDDEGAVTTTGPGSPQSEQTLYSQYELLDDALDAVAPGQAGVTELFTITFGGDGNQDVFLSEAVGADAALADVFGSGEHGVVLANSTTRPQERPFATASSLQRALAAYADRMNLDEDILALVLTSHGSPDHHLAVSLPPYEFDDLTPEGLRTALDEAGIRYRVVIVSACYSGGFIDALSGPDTMVITASAADKTSFGCRDGAQWTDFGRAYFAEALPQAASFEGAFRIASRHIAEREAKEGLPASQPQIIVGEGIRERLQRLETRHGGRILFAMNKQTKKAG